LGSGVPPVIVPPVIVKLRLDGLVSASFGGSDVVCGFVPLLLLLQFEALHPRPGGGELAVPPKFVASSLQLAEPALSELGEYDVPAWNTIAIPWL
jgi:hypothetical protein